MLPLGSYLCQIIWDSTSREPKLAPGLAWVKWRADLKIKLWQKMSYWSDENFKGLLSVSFDCREYKFLLAWVEVGVLEMLCHAVTWYLSSELWVTWFPLELNGDPKPPKRQPLTAVQLFLVRPEPMVNGGRVERQKITNILIDNIKFRQELTKETHLLGKALPWRQGNWHGRER